MKTARYIFGNLIPGLAMFGMSIYFINGVGHYFINSLLNIMHMKPNTLIWIWITVGVIMLTIFGCAISQHRPTTEYATLIDETDSTFVVPDSAEVIADLGLDTNMWAGVNFSLARIKDVSYTPHASITLAQGGNRLASSQFTRMREVNLFEKKLAATLDSVRREKPGKPNSSVFLPMANELTRLANSRADRKVLNVFSDLMENTQSVSFYHKQTFALFRSDPQKIQDMLFAEAVLPDLTGIEVRLVYEPKNANGDAVFQIVSGFYKKLLEDKGATVTISANLSDH